MFYHPLFDLQFFLVLLPVHSKKDWLNQLIYWKLCAQYMDQYIG